jgi:hypothetical protein
MVRPGPTTFEFAFTWPNLKNDDYSASFSINECEPGNPTVHIVQCLAKDVVVVHAANARRMDGLFSVEMIDFAAGIVRPSPDLVT